MARDLCDRPRALSWFRSSNCRISPTNRRVSVAWLRSDPVAEGKCGSARRFRPGHAGWEFAMTQPRKRARSRRRGRAPALGSVRGPSPGRTGTGEARRFRPFGRRPGPPGSNHCRGLKKDRASETCKTHIASERRQLGVRVRREPRRSSAGGNFPLEPLPTQDPEDNPVRLHLHREASLVQLS